MTELVKGLPESDKTTIAHAVDLLTHYSFDLGQQTASQLTTGWAKDFPASWVRWAVIEALYQGRYKGISVDQILLLWKRRKQPCYRFNYEFERLVCNKFPRDLNSKSSGLHSASPSVSQHELHSPSADSAAIEKAILPALSASDDLSNASDTVPAWTALAEQIQRLPTRPELLDSQRLNAASSEVGRIRAIEPVSDSLSPVAKIHAEVEAITDQASFAVDVSAEAVKNKLLTENHHYAAELNDSEDQPPIHQFTPTSLTSDFYAKLKAVAEQGSEENL